MARNLKTTDLEAVWKLLVERATDLRRCARLYATLHLLLCRKKGLRYKKNGRRQHGACNPMPEEGGVKLLVERLGARDLYVELLLGLHEYAFSDKRFRRHEAQYAPKGKHRHLHICLPACLPDLPPDLSSVCAVQW